jgi:ABC-type phosphate/phosphonate transport system substrate-binding protein
VRVTPGPRKAAEKRTGSRRQALALMLGAAPWWRARLAAADADAPLRLGISESTVVDVNLNDARAAVQVWINRMMMDLNVTIQLSPKVFEPTEEILRGVRSGQLDAVALNIIEYRQVAEWLDPSELLVGSGESGPDEYLLLVKRNSEFRQAADLRGRRLCMLKAPKMCAAPAWLTTLLDEGRLGAPEQFFGSMVTDTKVSRVVLPVFFGQADACVTSRRGFATMCEMNPQVGRELTAMATSPTMVVCFHAFRRNYHGASRQKFIAVHATLLSSAAGRQIATLFQFEPADGAGRQLSDERAQRARPGGARPQPERSGPRCRQVGHPSRPPGGGQAGARRC